MATNNQKTNTTLLTVQCPINTAPGDPLVIGGIRGIVESVTDAAGQPVSNTLDANSFATVRIANSSIFRVSVLASTSEDTSPLGGASALTLGQSIYKDATTEVLSKTSGGGLLGTALGTRNAFGAYPTGTVVTAGSTALCDVLIAS